MDVATVTTADHGLLRAVRTVLAEADEALLCVAFVQERGLRLLEKELEGRQARRAATRSSGWGATGSTWRRSARAV